MIASLNLAVKARQQLLRWRWPIVAIVGLAAVLFEVVEHQPVTLADVNGDFWREVLLFGVVGPLLGGLSLSLLAHTTSERSKATRRLRRERDFSQRLADTNDWEELAALVVEFPQTLVPAVGASLFVRDQNQDGFELANEWWRPAYEVSPRPSSLQFPVSCQGYAAAQASSLGSFFPCNCAADFLGSRLLKRYCLPLVHANRTIGLLHIYFSDDAAPSVDQIDCLNHMAPAMAVAIDGARPRRVSALQAEAIVTERERIARDLHDTLGQSLGYLQLKLGQLSGDDTLKEIEGIRRELERMREIAIESYEQVRGTVTALRPPPQSELATTLLEQARAVGDRAGFEAKLSSEGRPRPLATQQHRQILYVFGEALNNAEKHANARRVDIHLSWDADELSLILSDNGRGFDPGVQPANGHYGLAIMGERAMEVGGQLAVASSPGSGTKVIFTLPIDRTPQPHERGAQ